MTFAVLCTEKWLGVETCTGTFMDRRRFYHCHNCETLGYELKFSYG